MAKRSRPTDDLVIGALPEEDDLDFADNVIGEDDARLPGPFHTRQPEPYYPEDDLDPYYEDYVHQSPAQSPWFYAFLVAAAVIGAVVVFAIVRSIDSGGDDGEATPIVAQVLQVQLVSPRQGDRIIAGEEFTFAANVASSEAITRVELLIDDLVYAEGTATIAETQPTGTPTTAKLYEAIIRTTFETRGDHRAVIRVISGALTRDTSAIQVFVVEAPQDPRVEARIIATTSVRTGPADSYPEVDRLQPGAEVLIAARTPDSEWLLLDEESAGERWIRRNAVQDSTNLSALPLREVSGTPPPTATTPSGEPTETPTPSGAPDFSPVDARFVFADGGRSALRVSIRNDGADFAGPVVVSVQTSATSLASTQLVFDLSLRSGRVATVDFQTTGEVPERDDVTVVVDPDDAVRETNEDNNTVTFTGVPAPSDPPELLISQVTVDGSQVTVVVRNIGGPLPPTEISVRVTIGGNQTTQTTTTSMATDQSIPFTLQSPGTGEGTVEVLLSGGIAATETVTVPEPAGDGGDGGDGDGDG
jgi:hypothetical protein